MRRIVRLPFVENTCRKCSLKLRTAELRAYGLHPTAVHWTFPAPKQNLSTVARSSYQKPIGNPALFAFPKRSSLHLTLSPTATSFSMSSLMKRNLFVTTHKTPNPESLKYHPAVPVLVPKKEGDPTTMNFPNIKSAMQLSPLAYKLFQINGVKGVFFASDFITITKEEDIEWKKVQDRARDAIYNWFASEGQPILYDKPLPVAEDTAVKPEDSEVVAMIKEIIETRVRPAVQEDGGDILYSGFRDGVVFLKMQGSCSGCPSSAVTLKSGIERMLMHWVPEVQGVVAVDDTELDKISNEQLKKLEDNIAKNSEQSPPPATDQKTEQQPVSQQNS